MGVGALSRPPAVFLDRDGVINRNVLNPQTQAWESPLTVEDFVLAENALPALQALNGAGFLLFLVSNQPNYAKGKTSFLALAGIHNHLLGLLDQYAIPFAAFYYCLHHPHGIVPGLGGTCPCRKPSPFFLLQARDQFGLNMERSWMVGDRTTDVACGQAAGVHTILVRNRYETEPCAALNANADYEVGSLEQAAALILNVPTR
jgi:D-glycero-D-manno-heptose 1,7-bisphosphate phosphatase